MGACQFNYIKILFNIIGFTFNTFLLTLSKLTFLYLLYLHEHESKETWIAAMTVVLAVPEVIALVKLLWCTSFLLYGKLSDWPSLSSFVSGIVCSIMESTSLIFFLMRIGPKLHPIILIPLLSSVLCLKIVSLYFKKGMRIFDHDNIDSNTKSLKNLLCAAIGLISVILIVAKSFVTGFSQILTISESLILSTSLLALSFTWCPGIATFTIRSRDGLVDGRKNASIIYTILKLVVLFVLAVVITYLNRQDSFEESFYSLLQGFLNLKSATTIRDGLLIHLIAGLLSHAFAYLSARTCLTRSGIYLPTIFVTPLTVLLICFDNYYGVFHIVKLSALSGFTLASWFCLGIAVLLWLLPFLMLGMNHTPAPNSILKSSESNFLSFTYNNIFLEHHLHLNYNPEGIHTRHDKTSEMLTGVPKVSKIFICTTMYREAEFEMERLLKSLQRLSLSKKLSHVYMESHVILDNGCKGNDLGEFALQLLSLLQNELNIARTEVYANRMPYGLQLQWILNGGIPFFLHLKDTQKVKPKKRWSQVLYMNYIMSFRVKKAYNWIEKKLKLCEMESKPFNARYYVDERKFYGVDSLDNQTKIPTIRCDYASSMLSQYSDCTAYTSGDETSYWSDDSELSKSQYSTSSVYLHPNGLGVPKMNGKLSASNHSAVNSAYVYGLEDSGISWAPSTISDMVRNDVNIHINPKIEKPINTISGNLINDTKLNMDSPFLPSSEEFDSRTYILATDADMKFDDDAVLDLLNTCNGDLRLGAACGRTHPIGERNRPIVWFQMFEYAKDFWMIKSAQNIIGSVMCCPGCFSLYRVAAVYQLLSEYAKESLESSDVFIKDTGEDRWMCTLMMMRGWKLKYCTFAFNTTYCPSTVEEFLKQRRRWMLSDMANTFLVMRHLPRLVRHNACFTAMYIIYLVQLFLIVIISPGSTIIMITAGLDMVFGITFVVPSILVCLLLLVYMCICMFAPSKIQTYVTIFLIFIFGTAISCVFIGGAVYIIKDIIRDIESDSLEFQEHYLLILLTSSVFYAAILHPHETWIIFLGIFYMFMFPAMHILLPVYSISNIVDQSWGTRDGNKASAPKLVCFPKIRKRRKKKMKKKKDKISASLNSSSHNFNLFDKHEDEVEYKFWKFLRDFVIGTTVRTGAPKLEMAEKLRRLRVKCIFAFLICNSIWMIILGFLFTNVTTERSKFNLFASVSGSLYGVSFVIQMIGMTVHRTQDTIERFIRKSNRQSKRPEWIITKDEKPEAAKNKSKK
ncbi:chitin synthase chs-2-like isoform X1 [Octopus sinensis]|uniref:chitin synthase n=1 Tax=Octopus sinensis TaxID=2607531 RepID=A0A7E6F3Z9_9MOLL|nr:chitin synthase chs-2-like isoform X1 [Octopus sinensis]